MRDEETGSPSIRSGLDRDRVESALAPISATRSSVPARDGRTRCPGVIATPRSSIAGREGVQERPPARVPAALVERDDHDVVAPALRQALDG